jgi:hypothetical protein
MEIGWNSAIQEGTHQIVDFGKGLWSGVVESHLNGGIQVFNHATGFKLPELHLVDEDQLNHSVGGVLGKITGNAIDFLGLTLVTGGLGGAGAVANGIRTIAVGSLAVGLFTPTDPKSEHFFADRGINALVTMSTAGAWGCAGLALDGLASTILTSTRLTDLAIAGLSGIAGGFAHAESNSLLTGSGWARKSDLLKDGFVYGAFGSIYFGLGKGFDRLAGATVSTPPAKTTANP